jgi:MarR family transcriptional regulator, organic hydroperoxide resistance regulator
VDGVGTTAQQGIADGSSPAASGDDPACLAAGDLASGPCVAAGAGNDLTWLLHRCAQRMRGALDEAARERGLSGARDWIVLSAIAAGPRQTQLALAHSIGFDKTTMTSLLDRLEAAGLVTRGTDSRDRRARIPGLTEAGNRVQHELTAARDHAEAAVLRQFSAEEQRVLRAMLARLAEGPDGDPRTACSCM